MTLTGSIFVSLKVIAFKIWDFEILQWLFIQDSSGTGFKTSCVKLIYTHSETSHTSCKPDQWIQDPTYKNYSLGISFQPQVNCNIIPWLVLPYGWDHMIHVLSFVVSGHGSILEMGNLRMYRCLTGHYCKNCKQFVCNHQNLHTVWAIRMHNVLHVSGPIYFTMLICTYSTKNTFKKIICCISMGAPSIDYPEKEWWHTS